MQQLELVGKSFLATLKLDFQTALFFEFHVSAQPRLESDRTIKNLDSKHELDVGIRLWLPANDYI